jgi:FkbM family methyltransferase
VLTGRDLFVSPEIWVDARTIGIRYGSWSIVPDLISDNCVAYCFGLGEEISFEIEIASRTPAQVHGFDPTPRSVAWVSAQTLPLRLTVHPLGLSDVDGDVEFGLPSVASHVSVSAIRRTGGTVFLPVRRLATLHAAFGDGRPIGLLKMDIEGAEYAVIRDIVAGHLRPRQIAVEFHHRFPGVGAEMTRTAIADLRQAGYRISHVSDNGEEFLFVHELCVGELKRSLADSR